MREDFREVMRYRLHLRRQKSDPVCTCVLILPDSNVWFVRRGQVWEWIGTVNAGSDQAGQIDEDN